MRTTVWAVAVAMLGVVMPAQAQDKKVEGNIGGGYSAITGEARQHTGDAGLFEAGVTFNFAPTLGFKTNYNYTATGKEKTVTIPVSSVPGGPTTPQQFSADSHMHDVTFDLVVKAKGMRRSSPYGIVGPGVYHRTVNITTPAVGFATICDPYWYVCYPTPVAVDKVLGTRSTTDFGMNFGGGVSFKVGEKASIYFDVRYIYIWGPKSEDLAATPIAAANGITRANGQAVPFVVGFRF
jgi:opacity protein-like surface antigen